jgi:hypothetical protein
MASQHRLSSVVLTSLESSADIVARAIAKRAEQVQVANASIQREYHKLIGQDVPPSEVAACMKNFVARLVETGIMTERDRTVLAEKAEKEDCEAKLRQAEADASVNEQNLRA